MSDEGENGIPDSARDAVAVANAVTAAPADESAQSSASSTADAEDGCSYEVEVAGVKYNIHHDSKQLEALRALILPKPVSSETTAAQITADHIQSVQNVGALIGSLIVDTIKHHDERKLKQTQDEHHKEWHHWPLDGGPKAAQDGFLPLQYAVEAYCDYVATVYGRYFAGRKPIDWLKPTGQQTYADGLGATHLFVLNWLGLATITPPVPGGDLDS